ncbi:MAG: hypothetical protein JST90_16585 [Bacteroidetes bacterium]|nr:hypothetical protein [Bacteroidota bacterium]
MTLEEIEKEFEPILETIMRAHQIIVPYDSLFTDKNVSAKADSATAAFVLDLNAALHKVYRRYPHHTPAEIQKALRKMISKYQNKVVVIENKR